MACAMCVALDLVGKKNESVKRERERGGGGGWNWEELKQKVTVSSSCAYPRDFFFTFHLQ